MFPKYWIAVCVFFSLSQKNFIKGQQTGTIICLLLITKVIIMFGTGRASMLIKICLLHVQLIWCLSFNNYCHTEGFIHWMAELLSIAKTKKKLLQFTYLRFQITSHVWMISAVSAVIILFAERLPPKHGLGYPSNISLSSAKMQK